MLARNSHRFSCDGARREYEQHLTPREKKRGGRARAWTLLVGA